MSTPTTTTKKTVTKTAAATPAAPPAAAAPAKAAATPAKTVKPAAAAAAPAAAAPAAAAPAKVAPPPAVVAAVVAPEPVKAVEAAPAAAAGGAAAAAEPAHEEKSQDSFEASMTQLDQSLAALHTSAATIKAEIARLTKLKRDLARQFKDASKTGGRKKKAAAGGAPRPANNHGGFKKPVLLTDAMAAFLGVPAGTSLPRDQAIKQVHEYIKGNNLQNPDNKKVLVCDAKLGALLGNPADLNYFNLQRYLAPHFRPTPAVQA